MEFVDNCRAEFNCSSASRLTEKNKSSLFASILLKFKIVLLQSNIYYQCKLLLELITNSENVKFVDRE